MEKFSSKIHGDDIPYALEFYKVKSSKNIISLSHNINQTESFPINEYSHYPDRSSKKMTEKWAKYRKIKAGMTLMLNGASQGLYLLASYYSNKKVLILTPTYSGYQEAFEAYDAIVSCFDLGNDYDIEKIPLDLVDDMDLIIMGNPNNPTGTYQNINPFLEKVKDKKTKILVDESFSLFTDESYSLRNCIGKSDSLIVLESLTKIYGIAGLRIGAIYGPEEIIQLLLKRRPPWSVNQVALEALEKAMESELAPLIEQLSKEKEIIKEKLDELKMDYRMGEANYYIIQTDQEYIMIKNLLEKGFYVRPLSNFVHSQLKGIRVAISTKEINASFLKALEEVKNESNFD